MRRFAVPFVLLALAACGPTRAAPVNRDGGLVTGCDAGPLCSPPNEACTTNKDCAVGICLPDKLGKRVCQVQCVIDSDCNDASLRCDTSRGVCVVRTQPTSGTSGTGGGSTTSTTGGPTLGGGTGTTVAPTTSATSGGGTTGGSTTGGSTTGGAPCTPGSCHVDQACDVGSGQCLSPTGSGVLGASCKTFADCQSGYCQPLTVGARCVSACSASAQCPVGFLCFDYGGSGICLDQALVFNGSFVSGSQGIDQACTRPSTDDSTSMCHALFYCDANPGQTGVCVDTCGNDATCAATPEARAAGWTCTVGPASGGRRQDFCSAPAAPLAAWCFSDADCGSQTGACNPRGVCDIGNLCGSDADCAHGYCVTDGSRHYCSEPCCTYDDCPGATTCLPRFDSQGNVFRVCSAIPAGATGRINAACDPHQPGTCKSGLCESLDPANPDSTQGYCTSTCCTDADCAPYAASGPEVCRLVDNRLRRADGSGAGLMGVCVRR